MRFRIDTGAALLEMALVLPLLLLLVVGTVEFGRAYNAKITLTQATRESVRVLAISGDEEAAEATLKAAATTLNPDLISVSMTPCSEAERGDPTSVTASYPFTYSIAFFSADTITLGSTAVMRCGG